MTHLFTPKAPVFDHEARSSDFLLIRAPHTRVKDPPSGTYDHQTVHLCSFKHFLWIDPPKNGPTGAEQADTECYAVREIPRIYLCGQQEPRMEVGGGW
jgi:hypothetical protein